MRHVTLQAQAAALESSLAIVATAEVAAAAKRAAAAAKPLISKERAGAYASYAPAHLH
jgi:hypothetical protein